MADPIILIFYMKHLGRNTNIIQNEFWKNTQKQKSWKSEVNFDLIFEGDDSLPEVEIMM